MDYRCILCEKTRPGRFTRLRTRDGTAAATWRIRPGKPRNIPQWYCWTCLAPGQGSDEEDGMARPGAQPVSVNEKAIEQAKEQGLMLLGPVQKSLARLKVTTAEDYLEADNLLHRVRSARKTWGSIWERIQEATIKPLREVLDNTYQINRDVDGPMEKAEKVIKGAMEAFKAEERKQLAAKQAEADEKERKRKELEEKQAKAATPQMRRAIAKKVEILKEQEAGIVATMAPVQGAASSERLVKSGVVTDFSLFLTACAEGDIQLDTKAGDELHAFVERSRRAGENVGQWPGCAVVEKTSIVSR